MATLEEIESVIKMKMEPYQVRFIHSRHQRIANNWGRKAGKTEALVIRLCLRMLNDAIPGVGLFGGILVLSKGHMQSKRILQIIKAYLAALGFEFTDEEKKISEKVIYATTTEIRMHNKNRILALPAGHNGDNLRPYSFHEIDFDESDYQPEEVYVATSGCLGKFEGSEILLSTPNKDAPERSYFFRAMESPTYERSTIPTKACNHYPKSALIENKRSMLKSDFDREFECKFTRTLDCVYDRDLLVACSSKEPLDKADLFRFPTNIGVDFSRWGKDDSVIAFCHVKDGRGYMWVEVIRGKQRTTYVEGRIRHWLREHHTIRKIVTDSTGVGAGSTDSLIDAFGSWRVIGLENQQRVVDEGGRSRYMKVDLHSNFIRLMEHGKIVLEDDIAIIRSLGSMRYKYTKLDDLSMYGHDSHIAEALVRAAWPLMHGRHSQANIISMTHESLYGSKQ